MIVNIYVQLFHTTCEVTIIGAFFLMWCPQQAYSTNNEIYYLDCKYIFICILVAYKSFSNVSLPLEILYFYLSTYNTFFDILALFQSYFKCNSTCSFYEFYKTTINQQLIGNLEIFFCNGFIISTIRNFHSSTIDVGSLTDIG